MIRGIVCSVFLVSAGVAQISTQRSESAHFEVVAIHASDPKELLAPSGCLTSPGLQPVRDMALMSMLQALIAERFKLVLHQETGRAEAMVLVLEVGANGPKLPPN